MKHVAPGIGIAETARGVLVTLPPRFWLVVSLRRAFRKVTADAAPWTYLIRDPRPGRRLEEWIAAVELQVVAEARRRAWSAEEAEWSGAAAPAPAIAAAPAEPVVVEIPPKGTARPTLALIRRMQAGQVLVVTVATVTQPRSYRLSPSGQPIAASVAERAIAGRFLIPSCDGLFGPDWSQTWRAPTKEGPDAAKKRRGKGGTTAHQGRADGAAPKVRGSTPGGSSRRARPRPPGEVVGDGRGRSLPRRRGGVA